MASLHSTALASHSIGVFPSAGIHAFSATSIHHLRRSNDLHTHLNLRFRKEAKVTVKNRQRPVFATGRDPSENLDLTKPSDSPSGPPFLTILAGVIVFLGICWIIGSILMGLIGLIVHPPLK